MEVLMVIIAAISIGVVLGGLLADWSFRYFYEYWVEFYKPKERS